MYAYRVFKQGGVGEKNTLVYDSIETFKTKFMAVSVGRKVLKTMKLKPPYRVVPSYHFR